MIKKIVLKKKTIEKLLEKKSKESKESNVKKVECGLVTPPLTIWKTTIVNPYVYKNGQSRYGIVVVLDENLKKDTEFLRSLEELAEKHGVKSLGTKGRDGRIYIKFACKEMMGTYMLDGDKECQIELEDEFPEGVQAMITFDINLYYNTREQGYLFNLFPTKFVFCPDKKSKKLLDVIDGKEKESDKDTGNRPRAKNNRLRKN